MKQYQVINSQIKGIEDFFRKVSLNIYNEKHGGYLPDIEMQALNHIFNGGLADSCDESEVFTVLHDNRAVARAVAIFDKKNSGFLNSKAGFFNFFEAVQDPDAVNLLFDSISQWFTERSCSEIIGPMSTNISDRRGIALEPDGRVVFGMPYNPAYYNELLFNTGFTKLKDLFEVKISIEKKLTRIEKVARFINRKYPSIKLRYFDLNNIETEIEGIVEIYNRSWEANWGFIPISANELLKAGKELIDLLRFSMVIEDEGKPVAFQMILPDINKLYPNYAKNVAAKTIHEIDAYRALFIGVLPEYRMLGYEVLFYNEVANTIAVENGIKHFHIAWILEDNYNLLNELANIVDRNKLTKNVYRLYSKVI